MSDDSSASSSHSMTVSSAVVLGLLAAKGPQTTYDLKSYIEISIGFFWPFPSSQMYAETKRLEAAGLIGGEQEEFGRRRRVYAINPQGQAALDAWLLEPADRHTEIRDIGLLKLFLSDGNEHVDVRALADQQIALHKERLEEYGQIKALFDGIRPRHERTIELGVAFEKAAVEFWENVESS